MNEEIKPTEETTKVESANVEAEKADNVLSTILSEETQEEPQSIEELSALTAPELLNKARELMQLTASKAQNQIKVIRPLFFDAFDKAKKEKLDEFVAAENEGEEFVFEHEDLANQFVEIQKQIKSAVEEDKKRKAEEQKKAIESKKELITKLTDIVSNDETLESINQVKELQKTWKSIRINNRDVDSGLWDKFNFLLDKFYDNHSINIELKELDRKKNLEAKIELTKKMEALLAEKSIKKSFILLNKYHDEFKSIGSIPRESREAIWNAFKTASDSVYEAKKAQYNEIEEKRGGNLELKEVLVEKAKLAVEVTPTDLKGFNAQSKAIDVLFDEWKKIGPVPKSNKDKVWHDFNEIRNQFYKSKKAFFAENNKERKANLILKNDICTRVEELKDSTDWSSTTNEIISLQKKWKEIGPVPEKVNQKVWKRFRAACDIFFANKNKAFAGKREEETKNLEVKLKIVEDIKALGSSKDDEKKIFVQLKELTKQWKATGFVPHKNVKKLNKAYMDAADVIYKKYNQAKENFKGAQLKEHYKQLSESPDADRLLQKQQYDIKKKISFLNNEILSIERNLSFFAKSATADKMLKDFEAKIKKHQDHIGRLKSELAAIKSAKAAATAGDSSEESKNDGEESETDTPATAE